METERKTDSMEDYTGWFSVWVLLSCMEREFSGAEDAEKLEALRGRSEEMAAYINRCKAAGLLRLEDLAKSGGVPVILRGLSEIEQIAAKDGATAEGWRKIQFLIVKAKIEAWAQKMGAVVRMQEERQAARC